MESPRRVAMRQDPRARLLVSFPREGQVCPVSSPALPSVPRVIGCLGELLNPTHSRPVGPREKASVTLLQETLNRAGPQRGGHSGLLRRAGGRTPWVLAATAFPVNIGPHAGLRTERARHK